MPITSRGLSQRLQLQIAQGLLAPGSRLPSLRELAQSCGVARSQVVQAYENLVAQGLVEPRRGAGFFVTPGRPSPQPPNIESWAPAQQLALADLGLPPVEPVPPGTETFDLGNGLPPSAWLERCRLDRYLQKIGRTGLGTAFRYGDPRGYAPLRQNIAARLREFGIAASADQVVVTSGAYQAVDIVIRHLVKAGDEVLVDDPGFYPTFEKLRLQGARIISVQRTPCGPDIDQLRLALRRHRPRLFFTQSAGHNPTAGDMTTEVAREVSELARRNGVRIVDDDALADFVQPSAPRVGAVDGLASSIYIGSFSKSLSSIVRVGFLVCALDLADQLTRVKTILSLNSSQFSERVVNAVITEGRFLGHVSALQSRTQQATLLATQTLAREGIEVFGHPRQTLYLWIRLDAVEDALAFTRHARTQHLQLMPGAAFAIDRAAPNPWFRMNVAALAQPQGLALMLRLAQAWRERPERDPGRP